MTVDCIELNVAQRMALKNLVEWSESPFGFPVKREPYRWRPWSMPELAALGLVTSCVDASGCEAFTVTDAGLREYRNQEQTCMATLGISQAEFDAIPARLKVGAR